MKKLLLVCARSAGIPALFAFVFLCAPAFSHAAGTLTATQTVANFGVNDQTDVTTATQANFAGTDASRTLTINGIPTASTTSTIGSCVITYSTTVTTGTNCTTNAVIINVATNNTLALIGTAIRALTNVSDNVNGHGSLAISGSLEQATFTTSGTEASSSPINFVDGTGGDIFSSASTTGVKAIAQVNTITVGGTVEHGDVFTINVPAGVVTYTTQIGDSTLTNIANGIGAALVATSTYSSASYTVATSTNTVILTAKTAGTGFTQTSATTNTTPVAQVVTFTPNVSGAAVYTAIINGMVYRYTDTSNSAANIATGLASALSPNTAATCVAGSSIVTCTSTTPGTAFTYSASTSAVTNYVAGGGGGSGGGGGYYYSPTVTSSKPTTTTTVPTITTPSTTKTTATSTGSNPVSYPTFTASTITNTLLYGTESSEVKALQTLLSSDASLGFTSTATGYFGPITLAAVEAFQVKYSIVAPGQPGYGDVGPKTRAMIMKVFG